ncbi:MAG: DUF1501 domain-containing protein [Planctomycetia bacterium]|nr:DUF1501 domain-containing protein [Planctomycetia bacterium]
MLRRQSCCGTPAHEFHRRQFLQGGLATALGVSFGGLHAAYNVAWADELRKQNKRVLMLWLAGGASQLETFDPKPGRPTGGPFKAISTAVPGVEICELMPKLAKRLDRLAIVRSLDTKIADHGTASNLMDAGRTPEPGIAYPDLGTVISKELAQKDSKVPDYVSLYLATEGHRKPSPGFLGGGYSAMHLSQSMRPENIDLPADYTSAQHQEREDLRRLLSERFERERGAAKVKGYNSTYARVRGLMACDSLFDLDQEPQEVRDRYGKTDFCQHALIARRLIEAGVPMVKVARAWWDSHADNFESHRELATELDHVYSTLLDDLAERGLLESTLIFTLSEFGRTPQINKDCGRDHFASAWSFSLAGCGVKGGACYGKTDANGVAVLDGKAGAGEVLATVYKAVGIDPTKHYYVGARPVPLAPEKSEPIGAVLA